MTDPNPELWYRYEDVHYSNGVNEGGDVIPGPGPIGIRERTYKVIKHTPKGVQLVEGHPNGYQFYADIPRLVLHNSYKKFACATKEEAAISFLARKKRQESIYIVRARSARRAIEEFDRYCKKEDIKLPS